MHVSEGISGNFLKMHVSEIRVKRIRVNQGLGVAHRENVLVLPESGGESFRPSSTGF